MHSMNSDADIQHILAHHRTVAIVGLSPKPHRASFGVAQYLQEHGYRIIPVNPNAHNVLGQKAYSSLTEAAAAGESIELVNVFRNSDEVPPVIEEAIAVGALAVWLQLGITNDDAAEMAEAAGLMVVQDRCIKTEHSRLGL